MTWSFDDIKIVMNRLMKSADLCISVVLNRNSNASQEVKEEILVHRK